jgi:excisionase family DNA binding protein
LTLSLAGWFYYGHAVRYSRIAEQYPYHIAEDNMMQVPDPAITPTLRVEEVARLLHVSRSSAYLAVKSGEIPCIRIGKRVVVPTAPVLEMLGIRASSGSSSTLPVGKRGSRPRLDAADAAEGGDENRGQHALPAEAGGST